MARYDNALRNATLGLIESYISLFNSVSPQLYLWESDPPDEPNDTPEGTRLAILVAPSPNFLTNPSDGSVQKTAGDWSTPVWGAEDAGTANYYQIVGDGGWVYIDGPVSDLDGAGDLKMANPVINIADQITLNVLSIFAGNIGS